MADAPRRRPSSRPDRSTAARPAASAEGSAKSSAKGSAEGSEPKPGNASTPNTARRVPSERVRRRRSLLKLSLVALVLVGFLFVFVYPTRTFLQQRDQTNTAQQHLELLRRQTAQLKQETKKLKTNAEVERIAREEFGLVRPGETPYVIVPTPTTTAPAGTTAASPSTP